MGSDWLTSTRDAGEPPINPPRNCGAKWAVVDFGGYGKSFHHRELAGSRNRPQSLHRHRRFQNRSPDLTSSLETPRISFAPSVREQECHSLARMGSTSPSIPQRCSS